MSDLIHVATRKGVFNVVRAASGWRIDHASFLGDNCSIILHDHRCGHLYAALDHGHFGVKLQRSADGGRTWTEIPAPAYPPLPDGHELPVHPMTGKTIPWSLKLIWALEPGGDDEPGALWCGTLPGGLFRSDDHGDSWTINRPLWDHPSRPSWFGGGYDEPGIHSICVDPRDSKTVRVGVSCAGVWATTDGGATWQTSAKGMRAEYMPPEQAYEETSQDPHLIVQCPGQPDRFWTQHHNGIFTSTDAARTWSEITDVKPSTFGFAVAVHPARGDTAWVVPAIKDEKRIPVGGHVVVNRTTDGGRSWQTLTKGLPQEHAYDLVFRHCLHVDESGQRLVMGSTTGSLWISEDGGDSWQTVSTQLPPVYCTRFSFA
ncbi:MAG: hypothetical protein KDA25_05155 [Phycisphaerales bacterium]|nr:hypothetical protein [Phycisphaerales bacterium]